MHGIIPSTTICIHEGEFRASLVLYFGAWLPAELNPLYAEAIHKLRNSGCGVRNENGNGVHYEENGFLCERQPARKVVQITNFEGNGGADCVRRLLREVLAAAVRHDARDLIAVVSPRDARAYCAVWGFEDLLPDDPPREWDMARDILGKHVPTRLIRLRLDEVDFGRL